MKSIFYYLIIFTFLYSSSSAQEIIMAADTVSACSGTFKDPGGDADYPGAQNMQMTLSSEQAGMEISVTFTMFHLEDNFDILSIYNGIGTADSLIGNYSGIELLGQTIKSIEGSGSLTFVFTSDWAGSMPGWEAEISCVYQCQDFSATVNLDGNSIPDSINICIGSQINVSAVGDYFNNNGDYLQDDGTSTFTWDFGNNQVYTGTNSNCTYSFAGNLEMIITIEDVNGCIYRDTSMVNVICGDTCPACIDIIPSDPNTIGCSGIFWDSGMGTSGYQNNENETITLCSDNGGYIQLEFFEFNLDQSSIDKLRIFDGPDNSYPLIGVYSTINPPPSYVFASSSCLTATFTSGAAWSTSGTGWQAEVSCNEPCQNINASIESNISEDSEGHFVSCNKDTLRLSHTLSFPENDTYYHQSADIMVYEWSNYNGLLSNNDTLEYVFNSVSSHIYLEIKDTNRCVYRDTFILRAECQLMDPQILIDNLITTDNQFFAANQTAVNISFDFGFDPSDACYNNSITHTFKLGSVQTASPDIFLMGTDTTITYPDYSQKWLVLQIEDSVGCTFKDSVWLNTGCQSIEADLISNLYDYNNIYYTCINDTFNVSVQTSYNSSGQDYTQTDALNNFLWDMQSFAPFQNTQSLQHFYPLPKKYEVGLEITDTSNCIFQFEFDIHCLNEPGFLESDIYNDTICLNDTFNLQSGFYSNDYSGFPIPLPDGNGTSYNSTLNISSSSGTINLPSDFVSLCLNMEHSYAGDLRMILECPNGQSTEIQDYPNWYTSNHFGEPCDAFSTNTIGTGYDYCFTNYASMSLNDAVGQFSHSIIDNDGNTITNDYFPSGDYLPVGTFSSLVGCPINGDWTLTITDNMGSDDGYIFYWGLNFGENIDTDIFNPWDTGVWTLESGISADIIQDENDGIALPQDTGSYYFRYEITNVAGCSYDTILGPVYVKQGPINIDIIGETDVQIDDVEIYYIANNNYTYEWFVDGGTIINTISNDSIQVLWNSLEGSVNVIAENNLNCLATDLLYINSTQIEEINELLLKVYPNPAQNSLFVESPSDILQIQIYSITGKKIYTQEFATSKTKLNISSLSQGQYLIKVINNESSEVVKFIKE